MVSLEVEPHLIATDFDGLGAKRTSDMETSFVFNAHHTLPITEQRKRLPIYKYRDQILYCLEKYQILILVGETGSGKSTQVPQYLYELGWHTKGVICVTEPRRVSAITLANRVALERGESIGHTVGFAVSFSEVCSKDTSIKYITEGILLRELLTDPLLMRYSVIIIDEAHERTLNTDVIMGLLSKVIKKRDSLKLIMSSATIDANSFADYFNSKPKSPKKLAVILSIDGTAHPIDIFYLSKPCADYLHETVETIWKIHKKEPLGDILAFLTGQDEVMQALHLLKEYTANDDKSLEGIPMYGSLSSKDQLKAFFTPEKGKRKVVIATNIAETSVTIPGIVYVVDCGFIKVKWFNANNATDSLIVVPVSKANAIQRAGRAGRLRSGKVYRLYTEHDFENLPMRLPPEIHRSELSSVILNLKSLGISNILRFDFPSIPATINVLTALETLYALGAIDEMGNLTKPIGYFMAELPLSSMLSKMLYTSGQLGCSQEILTIVAMLQTESVFSKPLSAQAQIKSRVAKRHFEAIEGDLITLLNVFTAFVENDQSKSFCKYYYLIYRNLNYAYKLREQLTGLACKKLGIPLVSCNGNVELICKCITAGFFLNAAYLHHSGVYKKIRGNTELFINPTSSLYKMPQSQYVLYTDLTHTTQFFMNNVTVIKEEWLNEMASHFYLKSTIKN